MYSTIFRVEVEKHIHLRPSHHNSMIFNLQNYQNFKIFLPNMNVIINNLCGLSNDSVFASQKKTRMSSM